MSRYYNPSAALERLQRSADSTAERDARLAAQVIESKQRTQESEARQDVALAQHYGRMAASELQNQSRGGQSGNGRGGSMRDQLFNQILTSQARKDPEGVGRAAGASFDQYARRMFGGDGGSVFGARDPGAAQAALGGVRDLLNNNPPMSPAGAATDVAQSSVGVVGDTNLGEALQPHAQARSMEFAQDFAAISEQLGQPGITQSQRQDLTAQFEQRYPEYARQGVIPQPMTKEQAAQVRMEAQRVQANGQAKKILSGEMPEEIMTHDRYGQLVVAPGIKEMWQWKQDADKQKAQTEAQAFESNRRQFVDELTILDKSLPPRPTAGADPAAVEEYNQIQNRVNIRRREIFNQMYGQPETTQPREVNARTIQQTNQAAQQNGLPTVADQDDFDSLPPGTPYVYAGDGITYIKD